MAIDNLKRVSSGLPFFKLRSLAFLSLLTKQPICIFIYFKNIVQTFHPSCACRINGYWILLYLSSRSKLYYIFGAKIFSLVHRDLLLTQFRMTSLGPTRLLSQILKPAFTATRLVIKYFKVNFFTSVLMIF